MEHPFFVAGTVPEEAYYPAAGAAAWAHPSSLDWPVVAPCGLEQRLLPDSGWTCPVVQPSPHQGGVPCSSAGPDPAGGGGAGASGLCLPVSAETSFFERLLLAGSSLQSLLQLAGVLKGAAAVRQAGSVTDSAVDQHRLS